MIKDEDVGFGYDIKTKHHLSFKSCLVLNTNKVVLRIHKLFSSNLSLIVVYKSNKAKEDSLTYHTMLLKWVRVWMTSWWSQAETILVSITKHDCAYGWVKSYSDQVWVDPIEFRINWLGKKIIWTQPELLTWSDPNIIRIRSDKKFISFWIEFKFKIILVIYPLYVSRLILEAIK